MVVQEKGDGVRRDALIFSSSARRKGRLSGNTERVVKLA